MKRVASQQSFDTANYNSALYEYTKKTYISNYEGSAEKIFKYSSKPECWEIPSKYFKTNNDPVKLFLMNNNIKGYIAKEYWKTKQNVICNIKQNQYQQHRFR